MADETVTTETEVTTSVAIDQPAIDIDASASPFSDLPPNSPAVTPAAESEVGGLTLVEPSSSPAVSDFVDVNEPVYHRPGGGFESPFNSPPPGLSMIERLERLEKAVFN